MNIARDSGGSSDPNDPYTTALYFTTEKYTYFIHVGESNDLVLEQFKIGDNSPQANPKNHKQFLDKRFTNSCNCMCASKVRKEEVDGETSRAVKKRRLDSSESESPRANSAVQLAAMPVVS